MGQREDLICKQHRKGSSLAAGVGKGGMKNCFSLSHSSGIELVPEQGCFGKGSSDS